MYVLCRQDPFAGVPIKRPTGAAGDMGAGDGTWPREWESVRGWRVRRGPVRQRDRETERDKAHNASMRRTTATCSGRETGPNQSSVISGYGEPSSLAICPRQPGGGRPSVDFAARRFPSARVIIHPGPPPPSNPPPPNPPPPIHLHHRRPRHRIDASTAIRTYQTSRGSYT